MGDFNPTLSAMARNSTEQLVHFLSDMYSVEQQALAQLVTAPKLAGDPALAEDYRRHHDETEGQAERVRERLEAHGGSASVVKDAIMKLGGKGFLLFARMMPETPGRLAAHSYSYEAMEWAGYEMLMRFAEAAGDSQTAAVAREIRDQERAMMERIERGFDGAEAASHGETKNEDLPEHVRTHLNEAHALEMQAIKLLDKGDEIAGDGELAEICRSHREQSRDHAARLESRLAALESGESKTKDAALALGGLNWSFFFQAQSDTPAKLAAFVYAFEHLKIGGYQLLLRTASRAGDAETKRLCEELLLEEREMAERTAGTFDSAARATLQAVEKA